MNIPEPLMKDMLEAEHIGLEVQAGNMSPGQGLKEASRLADLHPLSPRFFTVLGIIADPLNCFASSWPAYLSLARLKGRHFDPDPIYENLLESTMMLEDVLLDADTHRDEAGQSLYGFFGPEARAGRRDHLHTHLLLQDLLEHGGAFPSGQAKLYLRKKARLLPLLLNMKEGLEDIMSSEGQIPDLSNLFLVLGAYGSIDALPLLLKGLRWCTGYALNEAVLALVKTGFQHPEAVSAAVKSMLESAGEHECKVDAVEVLDMLDPLVSGQRGKLDDNDSLQKLAEEDVTTLLLRKRSPYMCMHETPENSRPWELTKTFLREAELQDRERPGALPDLEHFWYHQEGWETFDETWSDEELLADLPRRYRLILAKLLRFTLQPEFGREMSRASREFLEKAGRKRPMRNFDGCPLSQEEIAMYERMIFSHTLNKQGHSLAQEYLQRNNQDLWDDEREFLEALIVEKA